MEKIMNELEWIEINLNEYGLCIWNGIWMGYEINGDILKWKTSWYLNYVLCIWNECIYEWNLRLECVIFWNECIYGLCIEWILNGYKIRTCYILKWTYKWHWKRMTWIPLE